MNRLLLLAVGLALLLLLPGAAAKDGSDDTGYDDDESSWDREREDLDEPLAGAMALLALLPLAIAILAYQRTHNPRMLMLAGAFAIFFLKGMVLALEHDLGGLGIDVEDAHFLAIVMDLMILTLIAWTMFRK